MKQMKLLLPRKAITTSQHVKCLWCENGTDPTKDGVCRTCHNTLSDQLRSLKWKRLRQSYLATVETGYCHGFIVSSEGQSSLASLITMSIILTTAGITIPDTVADHTLALLRLGGIVPSSFAYHPCLSYSATAERIDHILPWHYYPSLFWHSENHQSLCLRCNSRKTQLDGSHRSNANRSV